MKTDEAVREDLAWYCPEPLRAAEPVKGMAFGDERVEIELVPSTPQTWRS